MSPTPSLVKSAIATPAGVLAVANGDPAAGVKNPVPSFSNTVTSPFNDWFTIAKSAIPSEFKSPAANATGSTPTAAGDPVNSEKVPLKGFVPEAWQTPTFCVAKFNTAISGRPLASKRPTGIAIGCCSLPAVAATGESENSFSAVRGVALESVTLTRKVKLPAGIFPGSTPVQASSGHT